MAIASPVCGVIDALANFQQQIIDAVNGRFAALRRLAELLEQLSDLTAFLPDISKLIPISAIDLTLYENLRNSCKFLNLPPSSGDPQQALGKLRAEVNTAYGKLLGQLNLHPLNRLSKLQEKMESYQQKFNQGALQGTDFMRCLQAACQAAVAVEGAVSSLSNVTASHVVDSAKTYLKNTVADEGKVLSAATQQKVDNLKSIQTNLKSLMDVKDLKPISSTK